MAREAKRYYLYARKRREGPPIWYVRFRDNSGVISSPLCTEETDRDKAHEWAAKLLETGAPLPARKPKARTFEEWAAPWWHYDSCPYVREKLANGYTISKFYCDVRRSTLEKHLIPEFGKYPLTALTPRMFRDFKMRLYNEGKLKPRTINSILSTARVMFGYAVKMEELETNPLAAIEELKESSQARGILTLDELAALFGPGSFDKVWQGELRHYGLNLLAASTGMRMGECQALQVENIVADGRFIDVAHSWNDRHGFGPPKWGSRRYVPIPSKVKAAIDSLLDLRRWGETLPTDVVFWGQDRNTPITKHSILYNFKKALTRIGIEEAARAQRVLLFHSYRHGFNTLIRGRVPDEQLRRVTGHKTLAMSDNYDHAGPEQLKDVAVVVEKLFGAG